MRVRLLSSTTALLVGLLAASSAGATLSGVACGVNDPRCGFTISVDGTQLGQGYFSINPTTGAITIDSGVAVATPSGEHLWVSNVTGNADPVLGFNATASTAGTGGTFSISFSLPISLSGPLAANSAVSYSLTSTTSAGAQISPLFGHVVVAQEVDSAVGGLPPLNKGVDVGNTFAVLGGPANGSSPSYTASSTLTGNSAYDLMSVTVAFSLSASSNVGLSGFVQQMEIVPEPSTLTLLVAGMGLFAVVGNSDLTAR